MAEGYWWCPECEEECIWSRVTSEEKHDTCGHPVTWIEPDATNWQGRAEAWKADAERLAEAGEDMREALSLVLCFVKGQEYHDKQAAVDAWEAALAAHEKLKLPMEV